MVEIKGGSTLFKCVCFMYYCMKALDLGIALKAQKSTNKCESVQGALNSTGEHYFMRIELIFIDT